MISNFGIYGFVDRETNDVVYIGSDSNIDKGSRNIEHNSPSRANRPGINTALSTEPDRYVYVVLSVCLSKDVMVISETALINQFKPKFNIKVKKDTKVIKVAENV